MAVLMSLGRSPTVQCILKRAGDGSHQAKDALLKLTSQNAYFQAANTAMHGA